MFAVALFSACCSRTPLACCSRTPFAYYLGTASPPFDRSSTLVLCGGASVLREGATGAPSSSDDSNIAALYVRVVWSSPSDMSFGLRGAAPAVFLFFQAGSSTAAPSPQTLSNTRGGLSI